MNDLSQAPDVSGAVKAVFTPKIAVQTDIPTDRNAFFQIVLKPGQGDKAGVIMEAMDIPATHYRQDSVDGYSVVTANADIGASVKLGRLIDKNPEFACAVIKDSGTFLSKPSPSNLVDSMKAHTRRMEAMGFRPKAL